MAVSSILTDRYKGWQRAIAVQRSEWALSQPPETAVAVRRFMRGCGIDIPLAGGYTAGVARFVEMFQDCLILSGIDEDNTPFDYYTKGLVDDGMAGPITLKAMERSAALGFKAWVHLKWSEIAVKDPKGKQPTFLNPVIHTTRATVKLFRLMRLRKGSALFIDSWFRSLRWNTIVGGARLSQHLLGLALDFAPHPALTEAVLRQMVRKVSGGAGGVGVQERWVRRFKVWVRRVSIIGPSHVDVRQKSSRWPYRIAV